MSKSLWYVIAVLLLMTALSACIPADVTIQQSVGELSDSKGSGSLSQPEVTSSDNAQWDGPMSIDTSLGYTAVVSHLGDYELPAANQTEEAYHIVNVEDRYGVVNGLAQVIVPTQYDQIVRAYQFDRPAMHRLADSILYLFKDGEWSAVDVIKRIQVTFERKSTEALPNNDGDFDAIGCNGITEYIKYHGNQTALPPELLFPALNGQLFRLYSGQAYMGTAPCNMVPGSYEDEIVLDFEHETNKPNTVAVFGDITQLALTQTDAELVAQCYPNAEEEEINSDFPTRAFLLGETGQQLLEFYLTDKTETVYHVFAVYAPEQGYREVYRQHKPIERFDVLPQGYDPTYSEVLFAGVDRNGDCHVVFLVAGKGLSYWTELFRFAR